MDRPSKRNREHQQRRSHPINTGTARTGQQHPQQQQQTSGGNYSSTDSENDEGTAVYESLTHNRKPLQGNQGGIPGTEALAPRLLSNAGNEQRLLNLGLANAPTGKQACEDPLLVSQGWTSTAVSFSTNLGNEVPNFFLPQSFLANSWIRRKDCLIGLNQSLYLKGRKRRP